MVKIGDVYVNAAAVLSISQQADGLVRIDLAPGVVTLVKGMTPDEVHAKLFAPQPLADVDAARVVLEWAVSEDAMWRGELETLARKALGR